MFKILLTFILTSCATSRMNIHPDTIKYVSKFNHYLNKTQNKTVNNLEVHFSKNLSYKTLAVCVRETFKTPIIYINQFYWTMENYLTELDREEIVFHELGHCVLNRSHEKQDHSIMYPFHLGKTKYQLNYTSYLNELFSKEVSIIKTNDALSSSIKVEPYKTAINEPQFKREDVREVIMINDIEFINNQP